MTGFPTRPPADLEERPLQQRWLIHDLWAEQAVGILGGEPKCGKSFLALDIAVAVAAGAPCLRQYATPHPGPVLLFAAEDAGHIVRHRLEGIAHAAGTCFDSLDIAVIDTPVMRIDRSDDQKRLRDTVERLRPRLLVLDPLVRLHRIDENAVAEIAPVLAFLRELQRSFATAVLLVHHARKGGGSRPGQNLRGSSELHAWGDTNIYLRRIKKQILMSVEHRAAAGFDGIELELAEAGSGPAFRLRRTAPDSTGAGSEPGSPEQRIAQVLQDADQPLSQRQIRERAGTRNTTVSATLEALVRDGSVTHGPGGYRGVKAEATLPLLPDQAA